MSQSDGDGSVAAQTQRVIRSFNLGFIQADEMLNHLNPELAREHEDMEVKDLMPEIAAELRTVDWQQHAAQEPADNAASPQVNIARPEQPEPNADHAKQD